MADYKDLPNGRQDAVLTHDEADGTFSRSVASHLRGWDSTDGAWYRLPVDHVTGALKVSATLAAGSVDIGIVDQGTGGLSAWKVTDSALTDGTARVGGTVALAAETTKVIGVTRSADGSGNLLTSSTGALDTNIARLAGTVIDTNSGVKSAGTQRVVLATDQPALTNALLVTATGNVASGVTDAGNAVKVGAVYTQPDAQLANTGQRVDLAADNHGHLKVVLWQRDGANEVGTTGPADALTNSNTGFTLIAYNELFNGVSWDRFRNNFNTTTGDTGTKTTATFNGATQTNYNARGAIITAKIGTVTGAVTTFQTGIQWSYDGGTTWLGLTALGANDTAVSTGKTYTWIIYPTNTSQAAGSAPAVLAPASGPTQLNVINAALPRTWRWTMTLSVATSLVLTEVDVNYIL